MLRLGYSIPERVGMSSTKLAEVDRLVKDGLDSLMYPGGSGIDRQERQGDLQ